MVTAHDEGGQGQTLGGFNEGDIFVNEGELYFGGSGDITRISADGKTVQSPWAHLGEMGDWRGSLAFDHSGVFGYDLIGTTDTGSVWRINSAGAVTRLASLGHPLTGALVIPNDPMTWGPWAGTILAFAQDSMIFYTIDKTGKATPWDLGLNNSLGNMQLIPPHQNFYGTDQHVLYGASAQELQPYVGQILITELNGGTLWRVRWDGQQFVKNALVGQSDGVGQWEGIGFSSAGLGGVPSQWLTAHLHGTVDDDGLPNPPAHVTTSWSVVSGPGTVLFDDAASLATGVRANKQGTYVFRLAASDSQLSSTSDVTVIWNAPAQPPVVDGGGDQVIYLPSSAQLAGIVKHDGSGTLIPTWSKIAGPGNVTFGSAGSLSTSASFSLPGRYLLRLTVSDGELNGFSELWVEALASGAQPFVSAGAGQEIYNLVYAHLSGVVQGAAGQVLQTSWSVASGPGTVTFDDPSASVTTAHFSQTGIYVLRLTVTVPGQPISASATTTVRVLTLGPTNSAPVVNAGPDQLITWPALSTTLKATATDDGLPNNTLTLAWSQVSGPGTLQFQNAAAVSTLVTVDQPGRYVARLTANDSQLSTSSDVILTFALAGHSGPGGVWVSGHRPDVTASIGQNQLGGQRQLELAIQYAASGKTTPRLLVVEWNRTASE